MFELFYNTPGPSQIAACVRKQLVYHQSLILRARRQGQDRPERPYLWILSSGNPDTVLRRYEARAMHGWPRGFWHTRKVDALRVVAINQLPATRDTLIVRLLGRGPTLRDALEELRSLPPGCIEHRLAMPVLLDFSNQLPQHQAAEDDMNSLEQFRARHAAWENQLRQEGMQQGRRQGQRAFLLRLLRKRFEALPDHVVARVNRADSAQLASWGERILTAATLDEVFTPGAE